MQQHDGERAVEQQNDPARELQRLADSLRFKADTQPFLEFFSLCF